MLESFSWPPDSCLVSFLLINFYNVNTNYSVVNTQRILGLPLWLTGKESTCNAGDRGSIPGLGRSPGEGKGYQLQCSGLENSMDCIVHGVTKSQTRLSNFHFTSTYPENELFNYPITLTKIGEDE